METRVAPVALTTAGKPALAIPLADFRKAGAGGVRIAVSRVARVPAPPSEALLGHLQALDVLDAESPMEPQLLQERTLWWRVQRAAVLEGFACAPWLDLDGLHFVDAWLRGTSWDHKLIGLEQPVLVAPGDQLLLYVKADLRRYPTRYAFRVTVLR